MTSSPCLVRPNIKYHNSRTYLVCYHRGIKIPENIHILEDGSDDFRRVCLKQKSLNIEVLITIIANSFLLCILPI